jgi:ATP-dependent protease HslVU (ClpYQ) ATPase subunit
MEFDKMFLTSDGTSCDVHEATRGVQNEFLKGLEGNNLQVFGDYGKYESINVSKVLFVFAGAFNNETNINVNRLSELGVKREFLGRVPLVFEIEKLQVTDLIKIAERSNLLEQWLKLACIDNESDYESEKYKALAEIKRYIEKKSDDNIIGARWISALIHRYFLNGKKLTDENEESLMPNKPVTTNIFKKEETNTETELDNAGKNSDFSVEDF